MGPGGAGRHAGPVPGLSSTGRGWPLVLRTGLASPGLHHHPPRELVGREGRLNVGILGRAEL